MGLPFYNSGVYNSGFYNSGVYNSGFYNGGGGGGDLKECVFLTYFENFDEDTMCDVPIIGDSYTIDLNGKPQVYLKRTIPDLYNGINALYNYVTAQDDSNSSKIVSLDFTDINIFTLEMWFLNTGTRSDYQTYITILQQLIFDPGFSSTNFKISGPYAATSFKTNYTLYNGTSWSSYHGNYISLGEPTRFVNTHIAIVCDRTKNEIRLYANGKIMYKVVNFNISNVVQMKCTQQNVQKQTYITGIAAFTYDKSEDEGVTYPVPNNRYA